MAHPGLKDPYRVKAKSEGYPARSVYKLEAIHQRHQIIKKGQRVVDLGCHPGSWLQFCSRIVGPEGRVLGIDLQPPAVTLAGNVDFLQADIMTMTREGLPEWAREVDAVLSDLAPRTSGIKWLDHHRSLELARQAFILAHDILRPGGVWLAKIFQGEEGEHFRRELVPRFDRVKVEKPTGSRRTSPEIYLLGTRFRKKP